MSIVPCYVCQQPIAGNTQYVLGEPWCYDCLREAATDDPEPDADTVAIKSPQ